MDQEISRYLLQLRRHHPFLATLSMFAEYRFTEQVEKFETDGKKISINPDYYRQLPEDERIGTLLHVTLHSALLHPIRRGMRNEKIWNIAADIVVNDIIIDAGTFRPPFGTAIEPKYKGLSVEQVYEKLMSIDPAQKKGGIPKQQEQGDESEQQQEAESSAGSNSGQISEGEQEEEKETSESKSKAGAQSKQNSEDSDQQHDQSSNPGSSSQSRDIDQQRQQRLTQEYGTVVADLKPAKHEHQSAQKQDQTEIKNHWEGALKRVQFVEQLERHKQQGHLPAGLLREIRQLSRPQFDWRTLLWRFMTRTPCDFSGFDRRFIHQKLYLEQLEGESLKIYIAVDTSGSVEEWELAQFINEVRSIVGVYQHIEAKLYYVDADIYGPYEVSGKLEMPPAQGGGGTEFRVFFRELEKKASDFENGLCIYLTDGYSDFPYRPPRIPVLWVVSHGGEESEYFPFGEVIRLSDE